MPVGEPAQHRHHHHSHSLEKLLKDHGHYYFPGLPNAAPARVIPKDARYSYYVRSRESAPGIGGGQQWRREEGAGPHHLGKGREEGERSSKGRKSISARGEM